MSELDHDEIAEMDEALAFLDKDLGSFSEVDLSQIDTLKTTALEQLGLSESKLKPIQGKLKDYRFLDEVNGASMGRFIRWIKIGTPEKMRLTNGGIVIDIKVDDGGMFAVCKNNRNMIFQVNVANSIIFERMNESELLIKTLYEYSAVNTNTD